ncbi:hypothetical protein BDV96DRAFT_658968 [Lophiotrema nucula]|uniref:Uncharacterized protein n=1 Tax=Lophiotrema nucula TaxID=690887 RepID=A0A6A5Z8E7_9PLEO|nr:hypothetical protein BDV96DRAFT_658968 [Lophiotrema nucula]
MLHTRDKGAVSATMRFIDDSPKWRHEKPYLLLSSGLVDECPPTNINFVEHTCVIKDLRYTQPETALGPDLFRLMVHESKYLDSLQQQDNDNPYMHETVDLLKGLFQTDCVIAYNARFRRNQNNYQTLEVNSPGTYGEPDLPSFRAHVDVSRDCGLRRIQRYLSEEEAQTYLHDSEKWRLRIVNVWRPLCAQVDDTPLAFCDPRSVNVSDLIAVDRPSENFHSEMYILRNEPNQQWYYLSHQKPHEVFVFVSWDSDAGQGSVSGIPHSAFHLPDWKDVSQPRESVEVRAIVIESKGNDFRATNQLSGKTSS